MQKTIIDDKKRQITWEPGYVTLYNKGRDNKTRIAFKNLICTDQHSNFSMAMLKKANLEPSDYRQMTAQGKNPVLLETKIAEKVLSDAKAYQEKYDTDKIMISNLPHNIEKKEIYRLLKKASEIERSDSEDNVSRPASLRREASDMMKAWKEKYPKEAIRDDIKKIEDKAAQKRQEASQALFYDADGWLNDEDKKKRQAEYISKAEALENKAVKLKKKIEKM